MPKILQSFGLIVFGGLLAGVLGGLFGAGIGSISPEFVSDLFLGWIKNKENWDPVRYGTAVGAVVGLFLGVGTMVFSILIATISRIFGRNEKGV
jgi:nitrate/nitrite transporter NarK